MASDTDNSVIDQAVSEGGSYDVIRARLVDQGSVLESKTSELNKARTAEFGSSDMEVVARTRVRTENNCIGRDIVQVGDLLIFGYNVFIGLKTSTEIADVFSLYRLSSENHGMTDVAIDESFLAESRFRQDFNELYSYYKDTRLIQLVKKGGKLLAGFQIGDRLDDVRVFRWSIGSDGNSLSYIDNRGERDLDLPSPHDYEWIETEREDIVHGRHPHININNEVFVEAIGGTLTVKVENNTEDGEGIYSESVDDENQSLNDAEIAWAKVGELTLLRILPYKETNTRYLVYNPLTKTVLRLDSIGDSCVQLPEDHGLIFPDGFYLSNGEYKSFDLDTQGLRFKRKIRSPNGEDVLYVFYEPDTGIFALLSYNVISKSLQNPIRTHGYALADDGTIVVFTADDEPSRVHPMQIWRTPYTSEHFTSTQPVNQTFFTRIGNAELVRGISGLYSVSRLIKEETVSEQHFSALSKSVRKLFDEHYWINESETNGIGKELEEITQSVDLIVDEFDKVQSIQRHSENAMASAVEDQKMLIASTAQGEFKAIDEYVQALDSIRKQRGHLATLKDYRYIDIDKLDDMDTELISVNSDVSDRTAHFLASDNAFDSYTSNIATLEEGLGKHESVAALRPDLEQLDNIANGLDLLSELIATLKIDDPTVQTAIIDKISVVYSDLNRARARGRQVRENMGSAEAVEQFAAQFKLYSQSVTNALGLATTPAKAEEQLTRLMVQLEEIEGQFGEHEKFLVDILEKREEIHDSFSAHKQQLLDAQQARAQTLADAAARMLYNIEKRAQRLDDMDALNTYLASDALVLKTRDLVIELRDLGSTVKADETESRLKMIKDLAQRALRDKQDLYTDGGKVIQLGSHKFSVNTEDLDLTIIPRDEGLSLHLIGTRFFEPIDNPALNALKPFWKMSVDSESPDVYRGEYLAYSIILAAEDNQDDLSLSKLNAAVKDNSSILEIVRDFATPRYKEGYQKGVHDADAATILERLLPIYDQSDLLRFSPVSRGLAMLAWLDTSQSDNPYLKSLPERARSAIKLRKSLGDGQAIDLVQSELKTVISDFVTAETLSIDDTTIKSAAGYLAEELGRDSQGFICSDQSAELLAMLDQSLYRNLGAELNNSIKHLNGQWAEQWELAKTWLVATMRDAKLSLEHHIPEAAALLIVGGSYPTRSHHINTELHLDGLLGEHISIDNGKLSTTLDQFLSKLALHTESVVPRFHEYQNLRHQIAATARNELNLDEFKPRPLSSFVRNKLINEAYLPLIGDNLAKQIGTVGENKRSDLNGLLMMISPPGYGKTTLMEYTASRLGLTFMKVNCPALGHDTVSLDPETAPNATARQELYKLNLSLEMGDNVMLYLDDIQHTNPEFLQKFISLCDSTRRIEGVWKGRTSTYDFRGRKFCVVMAGNPYTESGEMFRVPDMLANRADIYNLGDILSGTERQFELSYVENALSSNPVLAPLATRDMADVYKLIELAQGQEVATTDLSHAYSGAEINEITRVFQHLLTLRDVVLSVNKQYIASAAQEDKYRTDPQFLLQGSYRNMNKLAEKVSAAMNKDELEELISDHYRGEAQLLTQGAEANLLRLNSLRGTLSDEKQARWEAITADFLHEKAMGGDSSDAGQRIASQLVNLTDALKSQETSISVTNTSSPEFSSVLKTLNETIENTLFPLVRSMDNRISQDVDAHRELKRLVNDVDKLKQRLQG